MRVKVLGGPYDGKILYLQCPGTAVFEVGYWKGYYHTNGKWVNT